jgi:hypothetical protein
MKRDELITRLGKFPANADVAYAFDGEVRYDVEVLWLARDGYVALSTMEEPIYSDGGRPVDAPSAEVDPYWAPRKSPEIFPSGES